LPTASPKTKVQTASTAQVAMDASAFPALGGGPCFNGPRRVPKRKEGGDANATASIVEPKSSVPEASTKWGPKAVAPKAWGPKAAALESKTESQNQHSSEPALAPAELVVEPKARPKAAAKAQSTSREAQAAEAQKQLLQEPKGLSQTEPNADAMVEPEAAAPQTHIAVEGIKEENVARREVRPELKEEAKVEAKVEANMESKAQLLQSRPKWGTKDLAAPVLGQPSVKDAVATKAAASPSVTEKAGDHAAEGKMVELKRLVPKLTDVEVAVVEEEDQQVPSEASPALIPVASVAAASPPSTPTSTPAPIVIPSSPQTHQPLLTEKLFPSLGSAIPGKRRGPVQVKSEVACKVGRPAARTETPKPLGKWAKPSSALFSQKESTASRAEEGVVDGAAAVTKDEALAVQIPASEQDGVSETSGRGLGGDTVSDRGMEDLETADSAGTGLKGVDGDGLSAAESQSPTDEASEEVMSTLESIQSVALGASPGDSDVDVVEAATVALGARALGSCDDNGVAASQTSASGRTAFSLSHPARPAGKNLQISSNVGCIEPQADVAPMSVQEVLRWREAAAQLRPDEHHCFADEVDPLELKTSASSRGSGAVDHWRLRNRGFGHGNAGYDQTDTPQKSRSDNHLDRPRDGGRDSTAKDSKARRGGNQGRGSREEEWREKSAPPLEVSSSSWAAQQRERRREQEGGASGSKEELTTTEITRRIRSILNKLTLEKFDALIKQLTSCGISTPEHIQILMHEVMEKATTQHHFIPMYTDLCSHINDWCVQNQIGEGQSGFKRSLLNECQNSFVRYLKPPELLSVEDLPREDLVEAETKYKTAMIGNIRFVAALLSKSMLASKVIIAVTEELLEEPVATEALESLAAFLTAIGPMFDQPDWQYHDKLKCVFDVVQRHINDVERFPARIRCLLSDVFDLREAGWKDQKVVTKTNDGPMTIEEVHTRAAAADKSRIESQRESHSGRSTPKSGGGGWGQQRHNHDGWARGGLVRERSDGERSFGERSDATRRSDTRSDRGDRFDRDSRRDGRSNSRGDRSPAGFLSEEKLEAFAH